MYFRSSNSCQKKINRYSTKKLIVLNEFSFRVSWLLQLAEAPLRKRELRNNGSCQKVKLHSGKYWQLLAHNKSRFDSNLGPKKLIFCNFGAIFSHFSDFGAKFFIHFNFSRPFGRENLNFWASKLMKIYFCAKNFVIFFYEPKIANISHCWMQRTGMQLGR